MKFSDYKIVFLTLILSFVLSGCSSVKKAFDPQRKNSSEEFLVEKKSPLSVPPDFDKLPIPKDQQITDQDDNKDLKELLSDATENKVKIKKNEKTEIEKSIINKINNN